MGLRDWLLNMNAATQASSGFADSAQKLREEIAQRQLAQQMPDIINRQDLGALVSGALSSGNTKPTDIAASAMAGQLMPKNKTPIMTEEQLSALIPADKAKVAAGLPTYDQQEAFVKATQQNVAESRRDEQTTFGQLKDFKAGFDKKANEIRQERMMFANVKDAIKRGSLPADSVVLNFVARRVAGEKGPLSDSDISRLQAATGQGTAQGLANWLAGTPVSKWTDEQREAYMALVKGATDRYEGWVDETIGTSISNALIDYGRLNGKRGPDESIVKRAKDFGFKIEGDRVIKEGKKLTGTGAKAEALQIANSIEDSAAKASALRAIERAGDSIDDKWLTKFKAKADTLKGAKNG